jgi:hypothetical protein
MILHDLNIKTFFITSVYVQDFLSFLAVVYERAVGSLHPILSTADAGGPTAVAGEQLEPAADPVAGTVGPGPVQGAAGRQLA